MGLAPTLVFIDTEFSGLGQSDPKLIAIALVSQDGKNEFYGEIAMGDGWELVDCTPFVQADVLPHLRGGVAVVPRAELPQRLGAWFSSIQQPCQIAADAEIDFRFLKRLLTDCWPTNLQPSYFDLREMLISTVFDHGFQQYFAPDRPPHNALNDSRANRCGWLAYTNSRRSAK